MNACQTCGSTLFSEAAHRQCLRCLIHLALPESTSETSRAIQSEGEAAESCWSHVSPCVFGDYEVGRDDPGLMGGMGVVYRARQVSLNRIVALKLIQAGVLATPEQVRRFRNEAQAAALLNHPNIVPIYDLGERQGLQYFSMKWLPGGSLSERIPDASWNLQERVRCMATVARAVHHAHQNRILHRDLKPANILLDEHGVPHVTDFGLAKFLENTETTRAGVIMGSADYMSPEQASGKGETVGISSDVFGLGALLYHVLAGQPPFHADGWTETLRRVQFDEPVLPDSINPEIDPVLRRICLQCLNKKPERRIPSAGDLSEQLETWLERRANNPASLTLTTTVWHKWVALIVILFVFSVGIALFLDRKPTKSSTTAPSVESQGKTLVPPANSIMTSSTGLPATGQAVMSTNRGRSGIAARPDPDKWIEWQILPSPPGGQLADADGNIILNQPGSLLITKAVDYRDVNFVAELEASPGTEAHFGVRLQNRDNKWVGMTSWLYDDGTNIRAGMQWSNFKQQGEHGMRRAKIGLDESFTIRMEINGGTMWIWVNGKASSGVTYGGPRFLTPNGHVGIRLTKGSLRIRKLEVERLQ